MIVEYFPTEEIWADVLTKPLQGAPFRKMRSVLMNMPEHYVDPDKEHNTASNIRTTGVPHTDFPGVGPHGTKKVRFTNPLTRAHKKTPRGQKATPLPSVCRSVLRTTKQDEVRPLYKQILQGNKIASMTKGKVTPGATRF